MSIERRVWTVVRFPNGCSWSYAEVANAHLIAAAPDLFTVVSKLLAARNTAPDALAFSIAVDEFIEEAEAAFNRATGA